ncbi:MAG: hypothetical protein DYH20_06275 [Gammaproteobacteria bacterium PRO9]|nr:hypothetical protein [Gammaproteobacteria bacterium PRO9]
MAPHTVPLHSMLVTGGLSANRYLMRCLATLCGVAVSRADDPEATARGLARLIAGPEARGWPTNVPESMRLTEIPGLVARFLRFRTLMNHETDGRSARKTLLDG